MLIKQKLFHTIDHDDFKIDLTYSINSDFIERVHVIKDLSILLNERMNFKSHIEFIVATARSILAWIKRFGREFEGLWTIEQFFFFFVLPVLENGSQTWNPHYNDMKVRIEPIQNQFLLFALRRLNLPHRFELPQYQHRLLLLQIITLEERRLILQIVFMLTIINGEITWRYIMNIMNFRIPSH